MKPISIRYIKDSAGRILESIEPEGIEAISPQTSFLITSMMKDVINYGTGMRANIGRPAAGKTGTSNDYKDAWFIGYTPQLVSGVWVGFDDMRRSLGSGEAGGRAAAPIWSNFMKNTLSEEPVLDFIAPEGIVMFPIDPVTGLLSADPSTAVYEFFKDGTQPVRYSEPSAISSARSSEKIEKQIVDINYD
jgi:penicillin-binding protein 1A